MDDIALVEEENAAATTANKEEEDLRRADLKRQMESADANM